MLDKIDIKNWEMVDTILINVIVIVKSLMLFDVVF